MKKDKMYCGKVYIDEELKNVLIEYGVIILGIYDKKLKCYENCLMSIPVFNKLMLLAKKGALYFDGSLMANVDELQKHISL